MAGGVSEPGAVHIVRANQGTSLTGSDLTNRLINKTVKQTLFIILMSGSSVLPTVYITHFCFPLNWPVYAGQAVSNQSMIVNSVSILFCYNKPGVNFFGCSQETKPKCKQSKLTQPTENQQNPNNSRRVAICLIFVVIGFVLTTTRPVLRRQTANNPCVLR